jgi:hypothetical protein
MVLAPASQLISVKVGSANPYFATDLVLRGSVLNAAGWGKFAGRFHVGKS